MDDTHSFNRGVEENWRPRLERTTRRWLGGGNGSKDGLEIVDTKGERVVVTAVPLREETLQSVGEHRWSEMGKLVRYIHSYQSKEYAFMHAEYITRLLRSTARYGLGSEAI